MLKLPYELIRDILLLSNQRLELHNQFYHSLHAYGTEHGKGGGSRRENYFLRSMQRQFANYRLICKVIEPIALELLLRDVVLCALPKFTRSFHALLYTKAHLRAYIRRILLVPFTPAYAHLLEYTRDRPTLLPQIRRLCPNLIAVETLVRQENTKWSSTDWLTGVQHIAITSCDAINWPETSNWPSNLLPSIIATNPRLETLIISEFVVEINSPVHIPTLRRLEIDTAACINLNFITAPLLEACTISISQLVDTAMPNACAFLNRNGRILRFLRIMQMCPPEDDQWDLRYENPTPLSFIHDLAHLCPLLDTIHILPFYAGDDLTQGPHPRLKTLIIDPYSFMKLTSVIEIWEINENKFASFDTVVFALGRDDYSLKKPDIMRLIKTDSRLFGVTCVIIEPQCVPVVILPCTTKALAAECARDPAMLTEVSARRADIPDLET